MNGILNMKTGLLTLALASVLSANAQQPLDDVWNVDRCMEYAVEHNHTVRQRQYELKVEQTDRLKAFGNFLPAINGGVGVQYNSGRSINPETNTYNDVNTFNNYYQLEASMPLFSGGSLVNEVRRSHYNVLMGKAALQEERDNKCLETFQAYIQTLYMQGMVRMARTKLAESDSTLYKTRLQEELGLKGAADVAQMEAQQATDAYNLTKQSNLLATAMLNLKQKMNFPLDSVLVLDTTLLDSPLYANTAGGVESLNIEAALLGNPTLQKASLNTKVMKMSTHIAWANLLPSISLFAGLSTSYYKVLHQQYPAFGKQLDNNYGTYFGLTLSVPIFNRLNGISSVRKARFQYRAACEQYEEQKTQLRMLVEQAVQDREGFLKESIQMERKEQSDHLAYKITKRKFEEGLATSLDVQQNAATWQDSQAGLLQSKLTYFLKCRLVDYYQGAGIIKKY